jgi:UDP-N-acetylglucosamine 2-epimerase
VSDETHATEASRPLKIVTIVGTRPEIIRLAPTIKRLDSLTDHVLVHTGQNYDYELSEVFFRDLDLRAPDVFLGVDTRSVGAVLASVLLKTEEMLVAQRPDAVLLLGDTNSSISALMAKRMHIPVYHMEAGNRSFDENVPEEINRKLVDHVADYNLVYTEHARRNLLSEGIHPSRIAVTGSPMREVLEANAVKVAESDVLSREGLRAQEYFLVSLHREENVDNPRRLASLLRALQSIGREYGQPILVSTHPRTRKQLEQHAPEAKTGLTFHAPFGFHDYIKLQQSARLVLSDSGTISEESSILGFPAVTVRDAIERPEALDTGSIVVSGLSSGSISRAVHITLAQFETSGPPSLPVEYEVRDTSRRVLNFILSTVSTHATRLGLHAD